MRQFLDDLSVDDRVRVASAMKDVANNGMHVAKHLQGDIYEVKAPSASQTFRRLLRFADAAFESIVTSDLVSKIGRFSTNLAPSRK